MLSLTGASATDASDLRIRQFVTVLALTKLGCSRFFVLIEGRVWTLSSCVSGLSGYAGYVWPQNGLLQNGLPSSKPRRAPARRPVTVDRGLTNVVSAPHARRLSLKFRRFLGVPPSERGPGAAAKSASGLAQSPIRRRTRTTAVTLRPGTSPTADKGSRGSSQR